MTKEYPVIKKLKLFRYEEDVKGGVPYEIPIYAIPISKKGFCKSNITMTMKSGEEKEISRCQNFNNKKNCNECVNLAKKLYKENH